MKKILIAMDYDPLAEKVAQTGYAVAKAFNAKVLLLHVVEEPAYYSSVEFSPIMGFNGYDSFSDPDIYNIEENLMKQSTRYLEDARTHLGDETIQISVVEGDFADAIVKAAGEFSADLIVMGTHGRRGLDKLLMGNLANKIINTATIPILAVPDTSNK